MEDDPMSQIVAATFENSVFKPHEEVAIAPGTRVRLIVDRLEDLQTPAQQACAELDDLCAELSIDSGGMRLTRDQLHERG
jgi:predicted DNA-binding antitoxin AbrB/MazE fold protein